MTDAITVMIVDDDPDVLYATARIVKKAGFRVIQASSAAECRALVQEQPPDLLLLDVVLPDTSGSELCKEIKADPECKNIFVILISGLKTSSQEQAEGLDVGADGYIARPISNQELEARVKAMVRILRAERETRRLFQELQEAQAQVKVLQGLLPICCHCNKIRDDAGYWKRLETFIQENSEAFFSHGICPECEKKYYSDV